MTKHHHQRKVAAISDKDPIRISLLIEHADDEVLVSETRYHIHAAGATKEDALEAFWRVFYGYEDVLAEREDHLSVPLKEQLQYIREVKTWEEQLREAKRKKIELLP